VLDIGANTGEYITGTFAGMGPTRIDAFEPVPSVYAEMEKRFVGQEEGRVFCHRLALSDTVGTTMVQVHNTWSLIPAAVAAERGVERSIEFAGQDEFEIHTTTLDVWCAENVADPTFIKLDVDGYELRVLRGGLDTLERTRCPIYFEYSFLPELTLGDSVEEMCELIYSMGYQAWAVDLSYCAESAAEMYRWYPRHTSFDIMLIHKG
jgi:FkbM family methyltransferase